MKNSEKGFVGLSVIAMIAVVVLVVGFAGYRFVNSKNNSQTQDQSTAPTADTLPIESETSAEATEEAVEPSDQDGQTTAPVAPQTTSAPKANTTVQKRVISFTKGGGSRSGDVVHVSSKLSEAQTGTCTYTFSLNGTVRVKKTNKVTSSNYCTNDIAVSNFPKSAIYSYTLTFLSSNGLVSASQAPFNIEIN